ncbi:MAG TPA: ATPase, T2SS/T4P/T4SS family [Patescibacteria group bacterium]|nr:ATPase, T2SS/T4P/T4SS family [Patescibacteria group bacterium]
MDQAAQQKNNTPQTTPLQNDVSASEQNVAKILLDEGQLSQEKYDRAKAESVSRSISIDRALLELNLVPESAYYESRAKLIGVPFVSVSTLPFSPEALSLIPKGVAERFSIIPFAIDKEKSLLSVAMANPLDLETLSFLKQKTGNSIASFQAIPSEIKTAIQNQYAFGLIGDVKEAIAETEEITGVKTFDKDTIGEVIKEAPIAKIVSTILEYAIKSKASDVHLEPQEDRVRIRYRIDGILYERLSLPLTVKEAVSSRIKILSDMKIDEHRIPQDGRFNFKFGEEEVDLRVSTLPVTYGEKIVMRLLKKSGGIPTLNELGLRGSGLRTLEAAILRPHGIIIVCGPTGSGKTTTLYAVLSKLNTTRVNIVTLEDPVEYQIPGSNQVQINPDVGLTFAAGLRSFLRQDPNIILVGEIRDKETTDLAIQASLTGHLVFSTLHTSNAASTLPRLIDMGAESFLLASTMNAIVGQRIVRKICNSCKKEYAPAKELIGELRKNLGPLLTKKDDEIKFFRGEGCDNCGHSGFLGRIGIYEVLSVTESIAKLVLSKTDAGDIEAQAIKEGMITMKQDGYMKVIEGLSTMDEILRVAQE